MTKPDQLQGIPPHDIETEQALLGSLLLHNANFDVVAGKLSASHFYEPLHQIIFTEIARQIGLGAPATPLTVRGVIANLDIMGMSGAQYLARLAAVGSMASLNANVPAYADLTVQFAAARAHILNARDLVDGCRGGPVDEALHIFHDNAEAIRSGYLGPGLRDTAASINETMEVTEARLTAVMSGDLVTKGTPTYLAPLDKVLGGFQRGELIIIAGRPSTGKSSLMVSVSRQMAVAGHGVGVMSLEMNQSSIGARIVTDHLYERCAIAYSDMVRGNLVDWQHTALADSAAELRGLMLPWEFDFANGMTVAQLTASARRMAAKLERRGKTLDVLFVDYLKFVKAGDRYFGDKRNEVGEAIGALRTVARVLNVALVLFHQLNREVEKTAERRPSLEHLRESGAAEEDADVVILLFREAYYLVRSGDLSHEDTGKKLAAESRMNEIGNKLELIVAKQRMGPAEDVAVFCDIKCSAVRSARPGMGRREEAPLPQGIEDYR